jgi:hypothetical protein
MTGRTGGSLPRRYGLAVGVNSPSRRPDGTLRLSVTRQKSTRARPGDPLAGPPGNQRRRRLRGGARRLRAHFTDRWYATR